MRSWIVPLIILFAGCVSPDENAATGEEPAEFSSETLDETWWLHQDGGLSNLTGAGSFPLAWSWTEWLDGTMPPLWQGAERGEAFVITSANVTLTYTPALPALPSTQVRPQFTMWFGAGDSIIEHGFQAGPDVWTDAETVTFPVDSLPRGGLVVTPGVPLTLHVGTYYPGVDTVGSGNLLLADSFVEIQGHTVALAPEGVPTESGAFHDLRGGRCAADLNPEDLAVGTATFEVPANATSIHAKATRVSGNGGPDLDFFLTDGAGNTMAYAAGPSNPESLHLYGPNLALGEPGTWTATAYNCQPQVSSVQIEVTVHA